MYYFIYFEVLIYKLNANVIDQFVISHWIDQSKILKKSVVVLLIHPSLHTGSCCEMLTKSLSCIWTRRSQPPQWCMCLYLYIACSALWQRDRNVWTSTCTSFLFVCFQICVPYTLFVQSFLHLFKLPVLCSLTVSFDCPLFRSRT